MTPACQAKVTIRSGRITELLASIGLPEHEIYTRNNRRHNKFKATFWLREEHCLLEWLDRAHKAYRQRMRSLHPDTAGDTESATRLNMAWQRIKYLFRQHGVEL